MVKNAFKWSPYTDDGFVWPVWFSLCYHTVNTKNFIAHISISPLPYAGKHCCVIVQCKNITCRSQRSNRWFASVACCQERLYLPDSNPRQCGWLLLMSRINITFASLASFAIDVIGCPVVWSPSYPRPPTPFIPQRPTSNSISTAMCRRKISFRRRP